MKARQSLIRQRCEWKDPRNDKSKDKEWGSGQCSGTSMSSRLPTGQMRMGDLKLKGQVGAD